MKNVCDSFAEELSALIDGELPAARRAEVEAHVAGCAHCRQRMEELQRISDGVAAFPKVQPATQFLGDVRRKIARGEEPKERGWIDILFRPVWLKVPLEAMAALVLLMSWLLPDRSVSLPVVNSEAKLARQEVVVDAADRRGADVPGAPPVAGAKMGSVNESSKQHYALVARRESMVVESDDALAVRQQIVNVAGTLHGFVAPSNEVSGKIVVVLPAANVSALKDRFESKDQFKARPLQLGIEVETVADFSDSATNLVAVEILVVPAKR